MNAPLRSVHHHSVRFRYTSELGHRFYFPRHTLLIHLRTGYDEMNALVCRRVTDTVSEYLSMAWSSCNIVLAGVREYIIPESTCDINALSFGHLEMCDAYYKYGNGNLTPVHYLIESLSISLISGLGFKSYRLS